MRHSWNELWQAIVRRAGKPGRKVRNAFDRKRLVNKDFSILCNNCAGGVIYSDLGQRFLSPTINLYITPVDFVKFLENPEHYFSQPLRKKTGEFICPHGMVGDIEIHFVHYHTFDEAKEKWEERKKRINWNNAFILMADYYILPQEYRERFEKLPYPNKILLTAHGTGLPSERILKKNSVDGHVGTPALISGLSGKRLYEYAEGFDYEEWLNTEK